MVSVALLVVLALTLAGHVCVLPLYGQDIARASGGTDAGHHDADDSVHAASCEGIRSTAPVTSCSMVVATGLVPDRIVHIVPNARRPLRPPPTSSPPLFVLHASLLI